MPSAEAEKVEQQLTVRTYAPDDLAAVLQLYEHGLLQGQIAPNDTGADVDNIEQAYLEDETIHFWVAEVDGQVLGMIGVAREREHTAEIRRLRVDPQWQRTNLASTLVETALAHCQHHSYLKVVFDTRCDPDTTMDLFDRFGFQHTRTRETEEKDLLEFYLDLYRQTKPDDQ